MEIIEYDNKIAEIQEKIKKNADSAWNEIVLAARKQTADNEERARKQNEAPCTACNVTDYIIKYRDVEGSIKGSISGYFSLFGGSISGYIDGETHTNPILACKNCGNEKRIQIGTYVADYKLLEENLPSIYRSIKSIYPASDWLQNKGAEIAKLLCEHSFLLDDSKDVREYSDEELQKVKLEYKYKFPEKPSFYWLKKKFL